MCQISCTCTKLDWIKSINQCKDRWGAGEAPIKGFNGESHFNLEIVSEAFAGMALVKRHQLIYLVLGETMSKIHALQISAKSPEEV